jgi:hypothetical protein
MWQEHVWNPQCYARWCTDNNTNHTKMWHLTSCFHASCVSFTHDSKSRRPSATNHTYIGIINRLSDEDYMIHEGTAHEVKHFKSLHFHPKICTYALMTWHAHSQHSHPALECENTRQSLYYCKVRKGVLPHFPYSPDMRPLDFDMFSELHKPI